MIGCNFLLKISKALSDAKHNTSPFGGINIIFAGDFAQLPPVNDPRLFTHVKTTEVGTTRGQSNVFGKLLWYAIDTVVFLTVIMRQSGVNNQPFVDLLSRLRVGSYPHWRAAPIIVAENRVKDAINIQASEAFARRTGRTLHWYYALD
ncbi:hypothetical protein K435DRAFT_622394, partial [Dendrothele bispora CBS 962.96]